MRAPNITCGENDLHAITILLVKAFVLGPVNARHLPVSAMMTVAQTVCPLRHECIHLLPKPCPIWQGKFIRNKYVADPNFASLVMRSSCVDNFDVIDLCLLSRNIQANLSQVDNLHGR